MINEGGWAFICCTTFINSVFRAIVRASLHLLLFLCLSVQVAAEAPECCRGQTRNSIHCQRATVCWTDVVQRVVRFPLSQVAELGEAQLLGLKSH